MIFVIPTLTVVMRRVATCTLPSQATLTFSSGNKVPTEIQLIIPQTPFVDFLKGPAGCGHGHDPTQTKSSCKVRMKRLLTQ